MDPKRISISQFKATCLRLVEEIRQTGESIIITKRGVPVAQVGPAPKSAREGDWLGSMRDTVTIRGDVVSPALAPDEWEEATLGEWEALKREAGSRE